MFRISFWTRIGSNQNIVRSKVNSVITLRYCSGIQYESQVATGRETFKSFIKRHLSEGQKSLLFYIPSEKNITKVISVCEKYGLVKQIFHSKHNLSDKNSTEEDWLIVEMETVSSVRDLLSDTGVKRGFFPGIMRPFIDIDFPNILDSPVKFSGNIICKNIITQKIKVMEALFKENWLWSVYELEKIHEFDFRLRFIVISYMNEIVKLFWKNGTAMPYGSLASGFATQSSDVDLTLLQSKEKYNCVTFRREKLIRSKGTFFDLERLLRFCPSGCTVNESLPNARYPLIKLTVDMVNVKCDISVNNLKGLKSSQLIFLANRAHKMVHPLSIILIKWARTVDLAKVKTPSNRISNFAIIVLVIFFLQKVKIKNFNLLPPLDILAGKYSNAELVSNRLSDNPNHGDDNEEIKLWLNRCLYEFFLYYTEFNFARHSICVGTGKKLNKNFKHPMEMINPVDKSENITRLVTSIELRRIIGYFKRTIKIYGENQKFTQKIMKKSSYEDLVPDVEADPDEKLHFEA